MLSLHDVDICRGRLYAECRRSYKWGCLCTGHSFGYKHKAFSSVGSGRLIHNTEGFKLTSDDSEMNLRKAQTQL